MYEIFYPIEKPETDESAEFDLEFTNAERAAESAPDRAEAAGGAVETAGIREKNESPHWGLSAVTERRGGNSADWQLTYSASGEGGHRFNGTELVDSAGKSLTGEVVKAHNLEPEKVEEHLLMLEHFRNNPEKPYLLPDWLEKTDRGEVLHVTAVKVDGSGFVRYETWSHPLENQSGPTSVNSAEVHEPENDVTAVETFSLEPREAKETGVGDSAISFESKLATKDKTSESLEVGQFSGIEKRQETVFYALDLASRGRARAGEPDTDPPGPREAQYPARSVNTEAEPILKLNGITIRRAV